MMNEWLTTGEMIDSLKVGETAESNCDKWTAKWHDSELLINAKENCGGRRKLTIKDAKKKWKIKPNYVPFEKAMKALKDGEKVTCHVKNMTTDGVERSTYHVSSDVDLLHISGRQISIGKWTIEGECHV